MKSWLKENWLKAYVLIIVALILGGSFYWFQYRPMEIKKGCSWIEKNTETIPEVTQAEIDRAKIYVATKDPKQFQSIAEWKLSTLATESPHPAIPSKTYYAPTDSAEYSFCLRSHGL